jgi:hypothetical protein
VVSHEGQFDTHTYLDIHYMVAKVSCTVIGGVCSYDGGVSVTGSVIINSDDRSVLLGG